MRIGPNGPQTLDWIKGPINGLAVSAAYVAWGKLDQSGAKPVTQIMLSAPDGTGVKSALSEPVSGIPHSPSFVPCPLYRRPGESRDPLVRGTSGGGVGPGFRRDDG